MRSNPEMGTRDLPERDRAMPRTGSVVFGSGGAEPADPGGTVTP